MLDSAVEHYQRQQRITARGLIAARRVRDNAARLAAVVTAFQFAAAEDAVAAVPLMLAEQGIDTTADAVVNTDALAGVASDGRSLLGLLGQATTGSSFDRIVATQLQDMARAGASLGAMARPAVTGYVRMLNPPSCSRCVALAGRVYKVNQGFLRHPKCDCRHVPVDDDTADDLRTDPVAYFRSLDVTEQDRVFTKAGAQAIRDGADISQVVNARRGANGLSGSGGRYAEAERQVLNGQRRGRLLRTDVYGQQLYVTREGITKRGLANKAGRGKKAPRLMPESIYEIATDREDALRLLKAHGYLL